jgi:hypothetical protein
VRGADIEKPVLKGSQKLIRGNSRACDVTGVSFFALLSGGIFSSHFNGQPIPPVVNNYTAVRRDAGGKRKKILKR